MRGEQPVRLTGADAYELERRVGHRSQRYIQRYTNPPETVALATSSTWSGDRDGARFTLLARVSAAGA